MRRPAKAAGVPALKDMSSFATRSAFNVSEHECSDALWVLGDRLKVTKGLSSPEGAQPETTSTGSNSYFK